MIKPVFISDKGEALEGAIFFTKDTFSMESISSDQDVTIYVLRSDGKAFLNLVDVDQLAVECFSELAILSNAFIRCMEINKVFCPQGIALYKKSEKKNGIVRYCNKHQCRICTKKCFDENGTLPYKEVDFSRRVRIKIKK